MRQFPVKIHHHHAPGYIAAKLQNTAKNTGWKNHEKIQKRTAAGGLPR